MFDVDLTKNWPRFRGLRPRGVRPGDRQGRCEALGRSPGVDHTHVRHGHSDVGGYPGADGGGVTVEGVQ